MNTVLHNDSEKESPAASSPERGLAGLVEGHLRRYIRADDVVMPASGLYHQVMAEVERPLLRLVMELTKGNQIKTAEILGINRNTLRKKLTEYKLITVKPHRRSRRIRGTLK